MRFPAGIAALALLASAPAARADTILVPSPGIPTIQDAVDHAWAGDVILVGPGTYAEPVSLFERTGIEIRGTGWPVLTADAAVSVDFSSGIVFRGLEFAGTPVSVSKSSDTTFAGVRFRDRAGDAIEASLMDGLLVSRCRFKDISGSALSLEEVDSLVVERCRFEDVGGFAVGLADPSPGPGSNGGVLSGNVLLRTGGGIEFRGPDLLVEDNRMDVLTGSGIDTTTSGDNARGILRRNRIRTAHAYAIQSGGLDALVEGNTVAGGGILATGPGTRVRANRVTGAPLEGIMTINPAQVEGNRVRGALLGIALGGDGSALVGNAIAGTTGPGIMVGALDCRIAGNRVTGAGGVGIGIAGTGHLVTGNRASGSAGPDLADAEAEGASTYLENRFGTIVFSHVFE
jgi:hypothetical protein